MGSINLVEKLFSDCSGLKLQFLTRIASDLFAILKSGPENYTKQIEEIKALVSELWRYVTLVSRLSISTLDNEEDFKRISSELKDLSGDLDKVRNKIENLDISGPFIIGTMRHLTRIKKAPQDFFTEAEKYGVNFDHFMCGTGQKTDLRYILADLKTSRLINDIPKGTKDLASKGDPVAQALNFGVESNAYYIYLKLIDYAQLLNGFNQEDEEGKDAGIKKIQTIAVVARNYNRLKQVMDHESEDSEPKRLFDRLLDVPIVPSLSKFGSMVKDISTKLNKEVDFNIAGGEVTMNKDSYYLLQDAFVHILRNSLDHGIEDPDQRKSNGKDPRGVININCKEIDAENIEIRIKDDGKGINHEIIAKKAVEKNIYTPDEVKGMSEHDLVSLIFLPSFSQKDEVSELSGRGVGMDVVKKNIQKLGGDIDVATKVGEGTEFILKFKASA
jgi:chemotaxis protein histidine kinase CheA